jgi:hypothetical protein
MLIARYKPRKGTFKCQGRIVDYSVHHGGIHMTMRDAQPSPGVADLDAAIPKFLTLQNDLFWERFCHIWKGARKETPC